MTSECPPPLPVPLIVLKRYDKYFNVDALRNKRKVVHLVLVMVAALSGHSRYMYVMYVAY